jgi:hypothetical protein
MSYMFADKPGATGDADNFSLFILHPRSISNHGDSYFPAPAPPSYSFPNIST